MSWNRRLRIGLGLISACIILVCGCGQSQEEVVQWVESNGGQVICDSTHDDKPVVKVTLVVHEVNDISPLAHLPHLQELCLRGCQVSDMSPLSALKYLKRLDVSDTQVSDLRAIAEIDSLQVLDLHGTAVEDVDPLQIMPNLRQVVLTGTNVSARRAITLQGQMPKCSVKW